MSFVREQVVKRFTRSSGWSSVRASHLKKQPLCTVCNAADKAVEVHHIIPVHIAPAREFDPANLKTLCRRHHFAIGHLENWRSWNKHLGETITLFSKLLRNKP